MCECVNILYVLSEFFLNGIRVLYLGIFMWAGGREEGGGEAKMEFNKLTVDPLHV